jgi:hypothetical protein
MRVFQTGQSIEMDTAPGFFVSNIVSSFSPLDLNPIYHQDSSLIVGLSNGDPAGVWTDLTGNGNDFTASGTARPIYITGAVNGLPALLGNGTTTDMAGPAVGAQTDWWGFIVTQPVVSPLVDQSNFWSIADYPSTPGNFILAATTMATNIGFRVGGVADLNVGAYTAGQPFGLYLTGSAAQMTIQRDNGATASALGNASRVNVITRLFNRGDGSLCVNAYECNVTFGAGVLTADQVSSMWQYLSNKWGTQIP